MGFQGLGSKAFKIYLFNRFRFGGLGLLLSAKCSTERVHVAIWYILRPKGLQYSCFRAQANTT